MTKQELERILRAEGFREDSYDLNGSHLPERLTLAGAYGTWAVYYSERGLETSRKEFLSESEACEYFLEMMREDPKARM